METKPAQPIHKDEAASAEEAPQEAPKRKPIRYNVDPGPCNEPFGGSPLLGMFR